MTGDEGEDDEQVGASDCALAIVVPLTWADFLADHDPASGMDFARSYGAPAASAQQKWRDYAPSAAVIRRLIDEVEQLGAKVVRRARLADLALLLLEHRVVTVVTHTRVFERVAAADIEGAATLLELLGRPSNLLREALRRRLVGPAPAGTSPGAWELPRARLSSWMAGVPASEEAIADALASALSSLVAETEARFARKSLWRNTELDEVRLRPWTRPLLEAELAGHLRPSKAIELVGGMITVPELVAAVPPTYDGVIDLSVCNSLFLSEPIKQKSPRCTVVWNRMLARLVPCVQRYVFILRELAASPASYVATFLRVTAALKPR